MNNLDLEKTLSTIVYIFDTREKKNNHIKAYFERHGIPFKVQKLDEGDYQIEGKPGRTVDRKQNMQEMYNCVVNDKSRFMKEVRRCYEKHIKLYVLIEHGGQIKSLCSLKLPIMSDIVRAVSIATMAIVTHKITIMANNAIIDTSKKPFIASAMNCRKMN